MVFSVVYLRRGASAGGFLWKAPGCENRASQSGLRGCVNSGSSRASLHWTGPLQTETMSQPQEPIHVPPSGIISQQPGKCTHYRGGGGLQLQKNMYKYYPYRLFTEDFEEIQASVLILDLITSQKTLPSVILFSFIMKQSSKPPSKYFQFQKVPYVTCMITSVQIESTELKD